MTEEIIKNPNLTTLFDESINAQSPYDVGRAEILPPPYGSFKDVFRSHVRLLSNLTPGFIVARPIIMLRANFPEGQTANNTSLNLSPNKQYDMLEKQLVEIGMYEGDEEDKIEQGAIDTARRVVSYIRSRQIAPPSLSGFGPEAILMLWVLGNTKFALTITDGELGYVVRRGKELLRKQSNVKDEDFDVLMLRDQT